MQRTMLELLNQLDGFTSQTTVKIIAATNRCDGWWMVGVVRMGRDDSRMGVVDGGSRDWWMNQR